MSASPLPPSEREFAAALLDASRPVPAGLRAWNGSDPAARYAVHRNNVVVSLVAALAETFPVVRRLVGEPFFAAMARAYLRAQPPDSPLLAELGDDFADWVAGFEPAAGLPYLADMARLERARVRAYHAADAAPIEHALLVGRLARPERLAAARLQLHPSLTPMRSRQGVVSLWCAHQSDRDDAIAAVDVGRPEAALVLRQDDDVLVVPAPAAVARFVEALAEGAALGEAAACGNAVAAAAGEPAFDLAAALALLLRHGALVAWLDPGDLA